MDLEHKLTIAKEELEKTALDKVNIGGVTNDFNFAVIVILL